jgi:peptide/nickel transport system substrate-binding protein
VSSAPSASTDATIRIGGTLRVAQASDITSLDPWMAKDAATLTVLRQVYETLVDLSPGGFKIVPGLAERWAVSADGRVWTFQLRQGVRFHDGTALDAAAVAFNFERARAFARFDLGTLITSVVTPDPATVSFTLRAPFAPFLATLATPSFGIVSPTCLRQGPAWATPATRCAAGTGPFRVDPGAWRSGDRVTVTRNPSYAGRDASGHALPYLDSVVFVTSPDESARVAELRAAGVDVSLDIGPASLAAIRSDPNLAIRRRPSADVSYLGISAGAPFDTVDVRRALAAAIDRNAILQTVYGGDARTASQLLPPALLGYDDTITEFAKYDPAAAKRALADAGYPNGFATELWYPAAPTAALPDPRRVAEAIAADLGRIGLLVRLRPAEADSVSAYARSGVAPLWIGDRAGERADPDEFLADVSTSAVTLELLRRARGESDSSKRSELYKQVTKLAQQDVLRVPLFHASPPIALVGKVVGLVPQPIVGESFTLVSLGR